MPKIKEVPSTEVHWQVAIWNIRDAANARIKKIMGEDAEIFAPVYVTHSSYYWSDSDAEGWRPLSSASQDDQTEAKTRIAELKGKSLHKFPGMASVLEQVFTFPNDDFIFVRRRSGDHLEVKLTGWGFANFNRAHGSVITETIEEDKLNEITVSFSIDGEAVPNRRFAFAQGMEWVEERTDDRGIFSFGRHTPGSTVSVRDIATGVERITVIDKDTTNINVDVTEYLSVRVMARHDDVPVNGAEVVIDYGRRHAVLTLTEGMAGCSLPWFDGEEARVSLGSEMQRRELRKDVINEFVFDTRTPHQPRTRVEVAVSGDGAPIAGERVAIDTPAGKIDAITDASGLAVYEFDTKEGQVSASVRDRSENRSAIDGTMRFEFTFDTPAPVEFDAYLRVVNLSDEPLAFYPVDVNLGDGSATVSCLTDQNGMVGPMRVLSGDILTAYDGNRPTTYETYELDSAQQEYIFRLPYDSVPGKNDMLLRVVHRDGSPAAGATCILSQDSKRITGAMDSNGVISFGSDDFAYERPVTVSLYSQYRTYPQIPLTLEKDEFHYELVEVDGPQPWWKIAGEIALAAVGLLGIVGAYFVLEGLYSRIPNLFA